MDCQLKVFDLRVLRPLPPVEVPLLQPLLLRCVPLQPSLVLVASQLGEFQFLDLRGLVTPYTMFLHQLSAPVEGTITCTVDISTSCQGIAFGDSCGEGENAYNKLSASTLHCVCVCVCVCVCAQVFFTCGQIGRIPC